jgi:hypothetical protein
MLRGESAEVVVRHGLGVWLAVMGLGACREYQEPLPFEDCQPYLLECALCTYEDDVAEVDGLRRAWRCETPDGSLYDAVLRDGDLEEPTDDIHYYDPDDGYRLAAERRYDAPVDVCGLERDVEWYGLIIEDCEVVCELEPDLPEADPEIETCG